MLAPALAASCTLTSDSYEPIEATRPLQPSETGNDRDGGAPPVTPAEPSSIPTPPTTAPPCTNGSEVMGCDIELTPAECAVDADCESRHCQDGSCQAATCDDGRLNQDETGEDCGGSTCERCGVGASCRAGSDCRSGVCGDDGQCAEPRCDDGVANGGEPVVDCGNDACGACANGKACSADEQCASELCRDGTCRPQPCADGVRNGSESDIDCGGNDASCERCGAGDGCSGNGDCASRNCIAGRCSSCGDGVRNGDESDVDCGGACGACEPGDGCRADTDCQSGACQDGRCCGGTRGDCTRCARRLARVLSCSSNGQNGAAQCDAFLDCLADNPRVCDVRYAPGCSDDPGGVCNHTAFGGNTGPGVSLADAILGTAACTFGEE
ncbi:MAG TPA: hypothetical protein VMG12_24925 [Polyangiaceae bacterium]|nr:hypothetical protein [Polyangiaceae bacterium]